MDVEELRKLDSLAEWLRATPGLVRDAMGDIKQAALAQIGEHVSAQQDPFGTPWPRSPTGKQVLTGAASAVKGLIFGTILTLEVEWPYSIHHLGAVKGRRKRRIVPFAKTGSLAFSKLPGPFKKLVREVLLARLTKGMTA